MKHKIPAKMKLYFWLAIGITLLVISFVTRGEDPSDKSGLDRYAQLLINNIHPYIFRGVAVGVILFFGVKYTIAHEQEKEAETRALIDLELKDPEFAKMRAKQRDTEELARAIVDELKKS